MDNFAPEPNEDEIDYMHPAGKPVREPIKDPLAAKPSWHDLKIALEEADGHYMPDRQCCCRPEEEKPT